MILEQASARQVVGKNLCSVRQITLGGKKNPHFQKGDKLIINGKCMYACVQTSPIIIDKHLRI